MRVVRQGLLSVLKRAILSNVRERLSKDQKKIFKNTILLILNRIIIILLLHITDGIIYT